MNATSLLRGAHEVSSRREAARALLAHPMLTAAAHGEDLTLVRVHTTYLTGMFATTLGYRLVVEPTFARLLKEPPGPHAPSRGARRASGMRFSSRTYTYLALVCAALLTSATGEQVLVSRLMEQVRAEGQVAEINVDDRYSDRRHLVDALSWLIEHGVVEETEGSVGRWGERSEEVLLSVNRNLLPHLLARPLHTLPGPDALLEGGATSAGPEQPRRSLRRKLVEHPVVDRDLLTDAERDVLSRERNDLARVLFDAFGLVLEVRAEGALAFDPEGLLTDIAFPGQGTVMQASLLLVDALTDTYRPEPGVSASVGGTERRGLGVPWAQVDTQIADLLERYGKSWAERFRESPATLREHVTENLAALGLAYPTPEALVLAPAAARFRPQPQPAPAQPRARARLDATHGHDHDLCGKETL